MDVSDEPLTGNKREMALLFRTSVNTITSWIEKGCPVIEGGNNGVPYKLNFADVQKWRADLSEREQVAIETRTRQIESAQAELFGKDDLPVDEEAVGLTPRQQADLMKARRERLLLLEQQGALVQASKVQMVLAKGILDLRDGLRSMPDDLKKRFGLSEEMAQMLIEAIDAKLDSLVTRIQERLAVQSENAG